VVIRAQFGIDLLSLVLCDIAYRCISVLFTKSTPLEKTRYGRPCISACLCLYL